MCNDKLNKGDSIDTMVWRSTPEKLITPADIKAIYLNDGYIVASFDNATRQWNISPDPTTLFTERSCWGKVIKKLNKPIKKSEKDLELCNKFWSYDY